MIHKNSPSFMVACLLQRVRRFQFSRSVAGPYTPDRLIGIRATSLDETDLRHRRTDDGDSTQRRRTTFPGTVTATVYSLGSEQ